MLIDWFTVVAQLVNFLILVVLLKYFLYGRVIAAMEKREQEIAARWDDAEQQKAAAAEELEEARRKNLAMDEQREQWLNEMRGEVEAYRHELSEKVRHDVDDMRARWSTAVREETDVFLHDLQRRASEEICLIAANALADLADEPLERRIVERFLRELDSLDDSSREKIAASVASQPEVTSQPAVATVQTTCELDETLREAVASKLRSELGRPLEVHFQQTPDLLCGIALQTDSHKLGWNLRDYLATLTEEVRQSLEEETAAVPPSG